MAIKLFQTSDYSIKTKLRIGVVVDKYKLPAWKNTLLQRIEREGFAEIVAVIRSTNFEKAPKDNFRFWKWHMQLDYRFFKPQPNAFEIVKIAASPEKTSSISIDNLKAIQELSLGFLVWLSDQTIPEEIYQILSSGVLYYVNGSNGSTDEQLLGYWEFNKMQGVITSSLMIKTNKESPARVIYQTWSMMPSMSISRSRNEHMWKLALFVPRAIKEISKAKKTIAGNKFDTLKPEPALKDNIAPSGLRSLLNLIGHLYRISYKVIRKLAYKEQWILLINTDQGPITTFSDFKKILPPKDRFWADPFLVEKADKKYIFFEELPFATDKGHLSVMEIDENGVVSKAVKILDKPYHLSYPFIFEFQETYYMIPESNEDSSIQLYECLEFPYRWEHKMNMMSGINAFDTTLYFHDEKWWLFTVIAEQKGSGHNDELFLFFAGSPFTTDWISHPQNPIISDVRLARPAGNIYEKNGKLIRPSQDCARKYGYGFNLNEIEVLTTTEYREKRILHIRPDWDKSLKRTHSFNHIPGMTVIDAVIQRSRFF